MSLAETLAQNPGVYYGTGDGIESGPFVSRIVVTRLPNSGVAIDYDAASHQHGSSTTSIRCWWLARMGTTPHVHSTARLVGRVVAKRPAVRTIAPTDPPAQTRVADLGLARPSPARCRL
jgi:hypothetical protein